MLFHEKAIGTVNFVAACEILTLNKQTGFETTVQNGEALIKMEIRTIPLSFFSLFWLIKNALGKNSDLA